MRITYNIFLYFATFLSVILFSFPGISLAQNTSFGAPLPVVTHFSATSKDKSIELSWEKVTYALGYRIFIRDEHPKTQSPEDAGLTSVPALTSKTLGLDTHYTLTDLENDHVYGISIAALDQFGQEGIHSREIFLSPKNPTPVAPRAVRVSGWIPTNWDRDDALKSFESQIDVFETASFFWYNLEPDGQLSTKTGARDASLVKFAHDHGTKVIPTITNNYDAEKTSLVLNQPDVMEAHVAAILAEVKTNNYDGIDLDYENVKTEDKALFTALVTQLSEDLHAMKKLLVVTLQPKESDASFWNGPGAADYDAIGAAADRVRIMTYDKHRKNSAPGPISPVTWMTQVLDYTKAHIPAEKIEAGIPFYGYDWCEDGDGEDAGVVWDGVQNILRTHADQQIKLQWDNAGSEPFFNYNDGVCKDVVYYQDVRSIEAKLAAVNAAQIGGISIWRVGSEDPAFYDSIRTVLHKLPLAPVNLKIAPENGRVLLSWTNLSANASLKSYRLYAGSSVDKLAAVADIPTTSTSYIIEKLTNGAPVYFALVGVDSYGRESKQDVIYTTTPANVIPPSPISDLKIVDRGATTLDISWTAPGDDSATEGVVDMYEIRYSTTAITPDSWDSAKSYEYSPKPAAAGQLLKWQLRGLESGVSYFVAVKSVDAAKNISPLSNVVTDSTKDILPPNSPSKLSVVNSNSVAHLAWIASTSDDVAGYRLYIKHVDEVNFSSQFIGNVASYDAHLLENGDAYDAYVTAIDVHGNESEPSARVLLAPRAYRAGVIPYFSALDSFLINFNSVKPFAAIASNVLSGKDHVVIGFFAILIAAAAGLSVYAAMIATKHQK